MKKRIMIGTALLAAGIGQAATISWQSSVQMYQGATVETFVNNQGTTAVGLNVTSSGSQDTTVNGVFFKATGKNTTLVGANGESVRVNASNDNSSTFTDGEFSGSVPILNLIQGGAYRVSTVELGGLQIGQQYLLQVFCNDARDSGNLNYIAGFGDGSGSTSPVGTARLNNSPVVGSPVFPQTEVGDSIIGTFTADAATMSINVFGSKDGGATWALGSTGMGKAQINAIQLRAIPEPATLGLIGAFGGGILFIRRRFMM